MNKTILIDAGHGGTDGGSTGNGIIEKELTLKISQYIKNRLDELGIASIMVRTSDETLNPNDRIDRIKELANNKDVIIISNHINAGGGDGAEVIYPLRSSDTLAKDIVQELQNAGQNVRKYYQRRSMTDPSKDYYYILRDTNPQEAVIVEYGFLDGTGDDVSQLKNGYSKLAEATVKGIAKYLNIPYYTEGIEYYTVEKGDSLYSISKKFNISVDELKRINNLSSSLLTIGQQLIVSNNNANNISTTNDYYTVQAGDTLYSIANKYNTTVSNLKAINKLNTNNIYVGQQLLLDEQKPESGSNINTYIVQRGDTLYSIANKYNTTISNLKTLNNLSSNLLSVGQQLKVPTSSMKSYMVQGGDTLYSIAMKFNTTVDDIMKANNLNNSFLSIGQTLIIP